MLIQLQQSLVQTSALVMLAVLSAVLLALLQAQPQLMLQALPQDALLALLHAQQAMLQALLLASVAAQGEPSPLHGRRTVRPPAA